MIESVRSLPSAVRGNRDVCPEPESDIVSGELACINTRVSRVMGDDPLFGENYMPLVNKRINECHYDADYAVFRIAEYLERQLSTQFHMNPEINEVVPGLFGKLIDEMEDMVKNGKYGSSDTVLVQAKLKAMAGHPLVILTDGYAESLERLLALPGTAICEDMYLDEEYIGSGFKPVLKRGITSAHLPVFSKLMCCSASETKAIIGKHAWAQYPICSPDDNRLLNRKKLSKCLSRTIPLLGGQMSLSEEGRKSF